MRDWRTLLTTPHFRHLWLALLCDGLGTWCVLATLPILVAERFGTGTELVISLSLRMLPRIVLAPASGAALLLFGARNVAIATIAATGALTVALPFCRDFLLLQAVIFATGGMDVFGIPALLALRSTATPRGLEMAGNTLFFSADRLAKFAGPALGGLAVTAGTGAAYLGFGAAMLLAAAAVARLPPAACDEDAGALPPAHIVAVLRDFRAMLRGDAVLVALLISAVPYMITFGGMRPLLFWANAEWFGASRRLDAVARGSGCRCHCRRTGVGHVQPRDAPNNVYVRVDAGGHPARGPVARRAAVRPRGWRRERAAGVRRHP